MLDEIKQNGLIIAVIAMIIAPFIVMLIPPFIVVTFRQSNQLIAFQPQTMMMILLSIAFIVLIIGSGWLYFTHQKSVERLIIVSVPVLFIGCFAVATQMYYYIDRERIELGKANFQPDVYLIQDIQSAQFERQSGPDEVHVLMKDGRELDLAIGEMKMKTKADIHLAYPIYYQLESVLHAAEITIEGR